jgi:hypothetical protein
MTNDEKEVQFLMIRKRVKEESNELQLEKVPLDILASVIQDTMIKHGIKDYDEFMKREDI